MRDPRAARVSESRREAIIEFLGTRHATNDQIARRFFASATPETARKKANRWLGKQCRRHLVRVAGAVFLRGVGRSAVVYGPPCPLDLLAHQVWVTEAELLLDVPLARGVSVGGTTADGWFAREGHAFAVEVDNAGKQSRRQYADKWRKYGVFEGFILVICHTDKRLQSVIRWAESKKEVCLFNTFGGLAAKKPWIDWAGETVEFWPT